MAMKSFFECLKDFQKLRKPNKLEMATKITTARAVLGMNSKYVTAIMTTIIVVTFDRGALALDL